MEFTATNGGNMICRADCKCHGHRLGQFTTDHECTELCSEGPLATSDYELLIRLKDGGRKTVTITAPDIFAAKTHAAALHAVTYEDVQILAILDRAPQARLA